MLSSPCFHIAIRALRALYRQPAFHLSLLTLLLLGVFLRSEIIPQDDAFQYQTFIETLAAGRIDFSIPGFHGASFLTVPLYLLTRSAHAHIWFQILCALCIPIAGYGTARSLLHDRFQALLFSYALALMPFLEFIALRGFTFPSFTLFLLLTLMLRARGSRWAFLALSIALLIKPFAIALLPLFILWEPRSAKTSMVQRGWVQVGLALILPAVYVLAEYLQIGRIVVGVHTTIDQSNVFVWQRFPLNVLHGIQMLFSIHNFYFPDPAKTGLGNLVHSSPILMLLGCLSVLYPRGLWKDTRLARALGISIAIAFLLAALLDHMDHFYMETAVILLTLVSIPFLARHLLLLPLALVTLHFQFFYLYLMWRGMYFMDLSLFAIPIVIDAISLLSWTLFIAPKVRWRTILSS